MARRSGRGTLGASLFWGGLVLAGCAKTPERSAEAPPSGRNPTVSVEVLASGPSEPARVGGRSGQPVAAVEGVVAATRGQLDEAPPDLLECLLDRGKFRSFAAMLLVTELREELGDEPHTVLVPNDLAFQMLPLERRLEIFELGDTEVMADLLRRHVVRGTFSEEDLAKAGELTTLAGTRIRVEALGGLPVVEGAQVLSSSPTAQGVMHEIDRVLLF